jgi:DNA-binding transcriptional LysR family regulator
MLEALFMDLRQLEYFVAVAEEANFTRAAARVGISQSGVSAQIKALERELGSALFDRSGRAATLTEAGRAALGPARAALASAGELRDAVGEVASLLRGRLAVGMVTACTVTGLFDALDSFHRAHPGVEVDVVEGTSDRLVADVRSGALDVALVGTATAPPRGLDALTVVRERLVACVAADHPLAGRARAQLATVCRHRIVSLPPGTGVRAAFDQGCATRGLQPDVAVQASAPDAVADLAARGLGVAVLSESMAAAYAERLHAVAVDDLRVPAVLSLAWRSPASPAVAAFVDRARTAFGAEAR